MRKTALLILAAALTLSLAACGGAEETSQNLEPMAPVVTEVPASAADAEKAAAAAEETPAAMDADASESDAAAVALPASESDAAPAFDPALFQAAQDCVGQPVEALYAAIGEPSDAKYAASCLEENAQDGMLFYDGFYVWTVKTETEELVHEVYTND